MSITLTYNGTTATLSDRLQWADEYDWSPVEQATGYATEGALLVDVAEKLAGQPITLDGVESEAWLSRALCDTLKAWAALPGIEFALVLRGTTHQVIFDQEKNGFSARPIWRLLDGEITPELLYRPTFRFLKV
ncbi:MAG: hypothetical protein ACTS8S_00235 [Giesbergeria sp.]